MFTKAKNGTKKRKQVDDKHVIANGKPEIPEDVGLEMDSGDEEEGSAAESSDEEVVDEFPVLNEESDSDSDSQSEEVEEEEDDDVERPDEEGSSDEGSSDDSLNILPKAKIVTSDITGQPKKVYPEIEPDYDSDSSTEEVC